MDFILGLPKVRGFDTVLVVVDRLTKCVHFIAIRHPYTTKDIVGVFIRVVKLHGFLCTILLDRDRIFVSHFWSELFEAVDTKMKFSSTCHLQIDGQTGVVNQSLETYLRCYHFE